MSETSDRDSLARRFERSRPRLRAVAYRMLGSLGEAEDAVQEAWIRLDRADAAEVRNLDGWLTTTTARICLNMLRSRRARPEEPLDIRMPDPIVDPATGTDPQHEILLADSVSLALQVVLETLAPAQRLAFVLHDMFAVPFETIAPLIDRSPTATRQLASRARRRVRDQAPAPDPDLARQRAAVDAFFAAVREGDLDGLVTVLHPDVVLHSDGTVGQAGRHIVINGALDVADQAALATSLARFVRPAIINGTAGAVVAAHGRPLSIMAFTVVADRIIAIDVLVAPDRLRALNLPPFLTNPGP